MDINSGWCLPDGLGDVLLNEFSETLFARKLFDSVTSAVSERDVAPDRPPQPQVRHLKPN
jgi:hypothetical protein